MIAQYKNSDSMTIVCRYTGIQATITLPRVGNLTLEYTHPLSHIDSALDASSRQDFMRRLDAPVLAGILITMLRHSKLLAQAKDHASAVNAQLAKASPGVLIKAIELVRRHIVTLDKTFFLPKVTFDYYESQREANRAIVAVVSTLVSEVLNDSRLVEQVRSYFNAHSGATTFDGYSRQVALERAREADAIRQEARQAELDRQVERELAKAKRKREAKEGMLSKRERAQKLKLIVQTEKHTLNASRIAVLRKACKQADLLPLDQLTKLSNRISELLEEHEDETTQGVLLAAQSIFTHCQKVLSQSSFSIEEELLGEDTVHGSQKESEPKSGSLLERIRAKRAAKQEA